MSQVAQMTVQIDQAALVTWLMTNSKTTTVMDKTKAKVTGARFDNDRSITFTLEVRK